MRSEIVQVKLPREMTQTFEDIRKVRAANSEPTTNKSIVIDAVKEMHSRLKKSQYGTQA